VIEAMNLDGEQAPITGTSWCPSIVSEIFAHAFCLPELDPYR